jgi:hypothetical protein
VFGMTLLNPSDMYFCAPTCVHFLVLSLSLIKLHRVPDIRQTEIHTAEPSVLEPRSSEVASFSLVILLLLYAQLMKMIPWSHSLIPYS